MSATELLYSAALEHPAKQILAINAHADAQLAALQGRTGQLDLWQHFKPEHDALKRMGLHVANSLPDPDHLYDMVLLLPSKNRQQTLAWMAAAMQRLTDSGTLLVASANAHGARSYETSLEKLAGNIASRSKSKCRIFSARKTADLDLKLLEQWVEDGKARHIQSHGLASQPGLFSWDRADHGSELLLQQLPELSGIGMDLCCGYGLLGESVLRKSDNIEKLHLIEADYLALECAKINCEAWESKIETEWLDAASEALPGNMEWIICNPPFHTGQKRDVELGQRIIENGCRALKPGGTIYLAANRKLPYEQLLKSLLKTTQTVIEAEGFKVIRGVR